jgi:tetratricopeptide (TPR) repeat protein
MDSVLPLLASLAIALPARGEWLGAAMLLEAAAEAFPQDRSLQVEHAGYLLRAGEGEKAEQAYRAALALNPRSLDAQLGLVDALIAQGRYPQAYVSLETFDSNGTTTSLLSLAAGLAVHLMDRLEVKVRYRHFSSLGALPDAGYSQDEGWALASYAWQSVRAELLAGVADALGLEPRVGDRLGSPRQGGLPDRGPGERLRLLRVRGAERLDRHGHRAAVHPRTDRKLLTAAGPHAGDGGAPCDEKRSRWS